MGETCQYEQKSLKTAFLLSFLLGNMYASGTRTGTGFNYDGLLAQCVSHACYPRSGADRLYLGYVGSGVAKLLINLFLCMLPCCPLWCAFFLALLVSG